MSDANKANLQPEPKAEPSPAVERKIAPQQELNFQEHGWRQMEYDAIASSGATPDDVLKREYWAHVSQRSLRSMTKIVIMADDRSWYGELIVWQTYSNGALVGWISPPVHLNKAGLTVEESEYDVFDGGLSKNWCVRRRKDNRNISDGHASRAEAEMWLSNWLKANGGSRRAA